MKKLLSILFVLTLLLAAVSVSASAAADVDLSGSTIVLSGGAAYQNNAATGADITAQVANMGLSYDSGTATWTMNGFIFATTAEFALALTDQNTTITVSGANSITGGTASSENVTTLQSRDGATVTINGAASGANTLTVTAQSSTAQGAEIIAMDMEEIAFSIGNNVTVKAIAGYGECSSFGLVCTSLTLAGTGKLIAQSAADADGTCIIVGSEPNVTAKNTADGSTPVWSDDQNAYMNGTDHATDLTLTAAGGATDYTLVLLADGTIAQNKGTTSTPLSTMPEGLSFADGVWTMNGFNFTTENPTALVISESTTLNIADGSINSIIVTGRGEDIGSYGIQINDGETLTMTGSGALTVCASDGDTGNWEWGFSIDGDLIVDGPTLNVKTTDNNNVFQRALGGKLTVNSGNVTLEGKTTGGYVTTLDGLTVNGGSLTVKTYDCTDEDNVALCVNGPVVVSGGSLDARAGNGDFDSFGIRCESLTVTGGTVYASAGTGRYLCAGLYIDEDDSFITVTGGTAVFECSSDRAVAVYEGCKVDALATSDGKSAVLYGEKSTEDEDDDWYDYYYTVDGVKATKVTLTPVPVTPEVTKITNLTDFTAASAKGDATMLIGEGTDLTTKNFVSAAVDGVKLTADQYQIEEGCIKLTLRKAFLNTLKAGKHTLTVTLKGEKYEGVTVKTDFTVKPAAAPKTGDSSMLALWSVAALCAASAFVVVLKKKEN